jgi:hypothetical protein
MPRAVGIATLLAGAVVTLAQAAADVSVHLSLGPPPIVVAPPPPLVVVPAVPQVRYVPSLAVDVFVLGGKWYYPHAGRWFVGPSYRGPWAPIAVAKLPPPILAVPVGYYRIPPGPLKHAIGGPPGRGTGKQWKH